VAMSTVAQRLMSLEEGTSRLRYRLLPLAGWRLLVAQDAAYVVLVGVLVLPLDVRAGVAFALAAVAIGRYPSVMQAVGQRRWRFTAGDLRFGAAQVVLGGGIGMGAARVGWPFVVGAVGLYVGSVVYGSWLWRRGAASA